MNVAEDENDLVTKNLSDALREHEEGLYGRAPTMAYSGAAAGVVQVYTVHRALGLKRSDTNKKYIECSQCSTRARK